MPPAPTTNTDGGIEVKFPGFVRNNGEFANTTQQSISGQLTQEPDAPPVPESLLPKGVKSDQVFAARDEAGQRWYLIIGRDAYYTAGVFTQAAQGIVNQGQAGIDSGAVTPAEFVAASRFLSANTPAADQIPVAPPAPPSGADLIPTGPISGPQGPPAQERDSSFVNDLPLWLRTIVQNPGMFGPVGAEIGIAARAMATGAAGAAALWARASATAQAIYNDYKAGGIGFAYMANGEVINNTGLLITEVGLDVITGTIQPGLVGIKPPATGKFTGSMDDLTAAEKSFVQEMLAWGKNVELIPREVNAGRTADFLLDGVKIELKTMTNVVDQTANGLSGALSSTIMKARGQSGNIIVDARGQAGMTREIAERGIIRAFGNDDRTGSKIQSVTVLTSKGPVLIPRKPS
jgi:hypothetical protein